LSDVPKQSLGVSDLAHTLENFVPKDGTKEVYKAFRMFAEQIPPYLMLCYGNVGNGKTYLLEATAIKLKEKGLFARVNTMTSFLRILKNTMSQKYPMPSYDQILDNYCNAPILLMDDVGMGMLDSKWETAVLEELINHRYHRRLWTALTTNQPLGSLPERVTSRFSDPGIGIIVENKGKDYRRRNATE